MRRESGQAFVETALTLPLVLFVILGSLQLFLLSQARLFAQYGVFQATRVGSLNHGACTPMTHAALLSVLPAVHSFLGDRTLPGVTPGEQLGEAFGRFRDNHYLGYRGPGWNSAGAETEALVWLVREQPVPTAADVVAFDQPLPRPGRAEPLRLEVRMIFWAPLRIPFADWVFSRIAAARLGLDSFTGQDPLMLTRSAEWEAEGRPSLDARMASELRRRLARGHYMFPIEVSSTMRMMTPPRLSEFAGAECSAPGFTP
ncbi:pilus assembly protein [Myxococcus sp. AM009]|uniref:TadE/TadG family type IV pilus assembly protein n=1 Tax=unclassified Myxococcus TaxID=2648731 RepID=UPI00159570B1|nr:MULTISPECIES: TadE family protein [unclassified Myxococcus]NVI97755.1 pilus assembly protein [Myxococcus sp. AM009]NVJ15834.1 pilus assembly protein [Myxococcus sp. AM010]